MRGRRNSRIRCSADGHGSPRGHVLFRCNPFDVAYGSQLLCREQKSAKRQAQGRSRRAAYLPQLSVWTFGSDECMPHRMIVRQASCITKPPFITEPDTRKSFVIRPPEF